MARLLSVAIVLAAVLIGLSGCSSYHSHTDIYVVSLNERVYFTSGTTSYFLESQGRVSNTAGSWQTVVGDSTYAYQLAMKFLDEQYQLLFLVSGPSGNKVWVKWPRVTTKDAFNAWKSGQECVMAKEENVAGLSRATRFIAKNIDAPITLANENIVQAYRESTKTSEMTVEESSSYTTSNRPSIVSRGLFSTSNSSVSTISVAASNAVGFSVTRTPVGSDSSRFEAHARYGTSNQLFNEQLKVGCQYYIKSGKDVRILLIPPKDLVTWKR